MKVVLGILGGGAFFSAVFTFAKFLIERKDAKKEKSKQSPIDRLEKKLDAFIEKSEITNVELELSALRTQMLVLMNHYPDNTDELFKLAERYFGDLHGDWIMTSLFTDHCRKNGITPPPQLFRTED